MTAGGPTEADLLRRAKRGDAHAFQTIMRTYETLAYRTAYVITGSAADAEEALQDALHKAYRALPGFRSGAPIRPWLLTIVANEARNRRRAAAARPALRLDADVVASLRDPGPLPESALLASERRHDLGEALARLSQEDRTVIACRFFLELSEAETAVALGVRRGTVKSRIFRALERLRLELEADDG